MNVLLNTHGSSSSHEETLMRNAVKVWEVKLLPLQSSSYQEFENLRAMLRECNGDGSERGQAARSGFVLSHWKGVHEHRSCDCGTHFSQACVFFNICTLKRFLSDGWVRWKQALLKTCHHPLSTPNTTALFSHTSLLFCSLSRTAWNWPYWQEMTLLLSMVNIHEVI